MDIGIFLMLTLFNLILYDHTPLKLNFNIETITYFIFLTYSVKLASFSTFYYLKYYLVIVVYFMYYIDVSYHL